MKKLSLTFLTTLLSIIISALSCNKKEKKGYTTESADRNIAIIAEAITPVHDILPADVLQSCVIDSSDFAAWFESNNVSKNGIVEPANSLQFKHRDNCDFYRWSEQMFLWMTSPLLEGDYSKGTVIESPVFYTVSPIEMVGTTKERKLIPHKPGQLISAVANTQKNDSTIDTEEGQATDDVLIAQKNGSLLYYISMVNDVYAQFMIGAKDNAFSGNEFPTKKSTLDSIKSYAESKGDTLIDPETLAIEIKTSWVKTDDLSNIDSYITMDAIIPTYTKTDTLWTPKGTETAKLAMIGMHIVGSTAGHPEMVWATFEHVTNAPNLSYSYIDNNNEVKNVSPDTGNDWLLNNNSTDTVYNKSHMKYENGDIMANTNTSPTQTISASNTKRTKPWGVADNGIPNPENPTVQASNSQIISINNSVLGKLADQDLRKNYIFIGATWTDSGAPPTGKSYAKDSLTAPGVAIGTSQLANSTMETYAQNGSGYSNYGSCFACHSNGSKPGLKPIDLSHIYQELQNGIKPTSSLK